jgi:hypothetical protein
MAEEKTSKRDLAGEQARNQTPEEPSAEGVDRDAGDRMMLIVRKETAIDLLNALTIALGGLPDPPDVQSDVGFGLAGDSTLSSDR